MRTTVFALSAVMPATIALAWALGLAAAPPLPAWEPDDLRLGMDPLAVSAVYTGLRSCANFAFDEGPGYMSWEAALYGRRASVEVRFSAGLAVELAIYIYLDDGEDGSALYAAVLADRVVLLGPPGVSADGGVRWMAPGRLVSLERVNLGRESAIRLVQVPR